MALPDRLPVRSWCRVSFTSLLTKGCQHLSIGMRFKLKKFNDLVFGRHRFCNIQRFRSQMNPDFAGKSVLALLLFLEIISFRNCEFFGHVNWNVLKNDNNDITD